MTDPRLQAARDWIASLGMPVEALEPASEDASFRRYL
ncbi:MAG TPA: aminoglycoside phosphotransferase, partial [Thiotrichales bacterium]|nr:aminoglycoside phosphotransferase [Thiotrichales bacterium]